MSARPWDSKVTFVKIHHYWKSVSDTKNNYANSEVHLSKNVTCNYLGVIKPRQECERKLQWGFTKMMMIISVGPQKNGCGISLNPFRISGDVKGSIPVVAQVILRSSVVARGICHAIPKLYMTYWVCHISRWDPKSLSSFWAFFGLPSFKCPFSTLVKSA